MYDVSNPLGVRDQYGLVGLNDMRSANARERRDQLTNEQMDSDMRFRHPLMLPNTMWDPFFEATRGMNLKGGNNSPEGSNQLRGQSLQTSEHAGQPDYLTTGRTFMGRENASAPNMDITGGTGDYESSYPTIMASLRGIRDASRR